MEPDFQKEGADDQFSEEREFEMLIFFFLALFRNLRKTQERGKEKNNEVRPFPVKDQNHVVALYLLLSLLD